MRRKYFTIVYMSPSTKNPRVYTPHGKVTILPHNATRKSWNPFPSDFGAKGIATAYPEDLTLPIRSIRLRPGIGKA